jgi:WD40 repeat protein
MNRAATVAILLFLCAWPGVPAVSDDSLTFLVAFTADGRLVVASHHDGIKVLSVPDLKEVRSFPMEAGRRLKSAAVSPNGRWLAADDGAGDLRIWDLQSGEALASVPVTRDRDPVYVFRPGADTLFIDQKSLTIWDVKQGREVDVIEAVKKVERMAVSPDGRSLMIFGLCNAGSVSGDVCFYAIDEKNVAAAGSREQIFSESARHPGNPFDLVYLEDGRILVIVYGLEASLNGANVTPGTYDFYFLKTGDLHVAGRAVVDRGQQRSYAGSRSAPGVQLMAVSPDGHWKTSASNYQKRLYLYRVAPDGPALERFIRIP